MRFSSNAGVRMPALLRLAAGLMLMLLMAACAPLHPRNPMATWVPSPNYNDRDPMLIVVHFTDQHSAQESLETLRTHNGGGKVSAHYLVGADGHIYQLVTDDERAWHAGAGSWGTITDVNSGSIGIELDNDGHTPFADAQIDSLLRLLGDLSRRFGIERTQVVGHEDIAPGRKDDPGPYFPWKRLAAAGFGRWPHAQLVDPPAGFDPWLALAAIGYPLEDRAATVLSFHHHFRGMQGDTLDDQDLRILYDLSRAVTGSAGTEDGGVAP